MRHVILVSNRVAAGLVIALLTACSNAGSPSVPNALGQASSRSGATVQTIDRNAQPAFTNRCKAFVQDFHELVACQRANGALLSFDNPKITWRVRYFVRFWEMPCRETPTVDEAYVFHMVTNDLYGDPDLSDSQRVDIRNAMFQGTLRCE